MSGRTFAPAAPPGAAPKALCSHHEIKTPLGCLLVARPNPKTPDSRDAPAAGRRQPGVMAVRCVLVDDNAPFLRSAASLLDRQGIDVVAVAADGAGALRCVAQVRPDVVLVDVDLGRESGFAVARQLEQAAPRATVIMMSNHAAADFVDLVEAGPGVGFLEKPTLSGDAIRSLLD